jgi:tagatose 6-phosphate kinase
MILSVTLNPAIDKVYEITGFGVGKVFRPDAVTSTAGGKGLNVARVVRLLGEQAVVTGFAGGSNGSWIIREMESLGVQACFIDTRQETRICLAIVDRERSTSTEVLEPGPKVDLADVDRFVDLYGKLVKEVDIVTASGSLPLGVPDDLYNTLLLIARKHQKKFILDTSGRSLRRSIAAQPFMVKPNLDEMEALLERKLESEEDQIGSVLELKKAGIQMPCLTLGSDGCIAAIGDGVYRFAQPPVRTVSAVGSGDAFVAGCAVALRRRWSEVDAIRLGMACGASNAQFFQTGQIDRQWVEQYFPQVGFSRLV